MVALQMRQSLSLVLPALPYRVHALSDPGDTTTGGVTWRLSVSSSPLGPTSPCMVLCDGTEQAFAPALLRLRPGCIALPADSVAVRTRHHSIPTPDKAELACRVCNESTYFARIFLLIPLYTLSYHLTLSSITAAWIAQGPVRLHSPRARPHRQPPRRSHLASHHYTRHRYRRKQALSTQLSHHYQEQEPAALTACAFLPSPAAFDHTTTTHRRSLCPILTRPTACLRSAKQRQSRLSCATATGQPRDE